MGSRLELFLDLLDQSRDLMRAELSLVRAEMSERASGASSSLTAVAVGFVLLALGLGLVLVAASLCLSRLGPPLDLAFFIVAVIAISVSLILLRSGVAGLTLSRFVPTKSISQLSSLFGGH